MVKISLKQNLILVKEYVKISLATAMEYRVNFLIQSISMMVNDGIWLVFWLIFFNKFSVVQGWGFNEILMLYAVLTLSWGIAGFIFGNRNMLATIIAEGRLDFYLNLPKNELLHLLVSRSSWMDAGDMFFGILLGILSLSLAQWPLFLVLSFISVVTIVSFGVIVGSLGFFIGNAEESSRSIWIGLVSLSSYPIDVFGGTAKILLLSLIPAGFITSVPVKLLQVFSWKWFLLCLLVAGVFLCLAVIIFKMGLRRYESGSMITTRT